MKPWGIQTDIEFIDINALTDGDWAMLREIQTDIQVIECIDDKDKALLMAFIAYLHIRTIALETKRDLNDELH